MSKRNSSVAFTAAAAIRKYWRYHPDRAQFHQPEVSVEPGTFFIVSNMVDGWPPKR